MKKEVIIGVEKDFDTAEVELLTVNNKKYYVLTDKLFNDLINNFGEDEDCYETAGYLEGSKIYFFDNYKIYFNGYNFKPYIEKEKFPIPTPTPVTNYHKMVMIGDSITAGYRATIPQYNYVNLLKEMLGINIVNEGVYASTIANSGNNPNISIYHRLHTNQINLSGADIIGVFGGTNDFAQSISLGSKEDVATVVGATQAIISEIKSKNSHAILFFVPPMWRARINSSGFEDIETVTNNKNLFFREYWYAIYDVCVKNNVKILNLYHDFKINKDTYNYYLADGLHPNDVGYHLLADYFYNFVHSIVKIPNNMR